MYYIELNTGNNTLVNATIKLQICNELNDGTCIFKEEEIEEPEKNEEEPENSEENEKEEELIKKEETQITEPESKQKKENKKEKELDNSIEKINFVYLYFSLFYLIFLL